LGIAAGCCTPAGVTVADQIDGYAASGAGWVRLGFDWSRAERTRGVRTWPKDRLVAGFRSAGLRVLGVVAYSPRWAASPACWARYGNKCAPLSPADFARFVGALAERYDGDGVSDAPGSPRVDAWEIWNEPNLTHYWRPRPNAATYTTLLVAAGKAIKSAAPHVTVVSGGLSPTGGSAAPVKFLAAMYLAGAHGSFDALGFHPYTYPVMPTRIASWNAWQQMFRAFPAAGQPDSLRSLMVANGDQAKKIWATEYGAPTGGDTNGDGLSVCNRDGRAWPAQDRCVTEAQQAAMLRSAWAQWSGYPWAGPMFWFAYQDVQTGSRRAAANFGLLRSDGSAKPALSEFRRAAGG
jgi:hypothetical protein